MSKENIIFWLKLRVDNWSLKYRVFRRLYNILLAVK